MDPAVSAARRTCLATGAGRTASMSIVQVDMLCLHCSPWSGLPGRDHAIRTDSCLPSIADIFSTDSPRPQCIQTAPEESVLLVRLRQDRPSAGRGTYAELMAADSDRRSVLQAHQTDDTSLRVLIVAGFCFFALGPAARAGCGVQRGSRIVVRMSSRLGLPVDLAPRSGESI